MSRATAERWVLLILLLVGTAVVAYFLFSTETGRHWMDRHYVRDRVNEHRVIAPLIFIAAYVLLAVLLMPIWWIQVMAGFCFGILYGMVICEVGATLAAVASVLVSRWIAGEWFHRRVESHMTRLRALDEKLGKNGLLVVMSVRLLHVVPFSISNYALGLLNVRLRDVVIGTLLGSITTFATYVSAGARGLHLLKEKWFVGGIVGVNLAAIALMWLVHRYVERKRAADDVGPQVTAGPDMTEGTSP